VFRTYDIRGVFGKDITPESFYSLGRAFGKFSKTLVAGMDYRRNNNILLNALFSGFEGEETFLGVAPTPAIAFNSQKLGASLTASHNPPEYSGLKPLKKQRSFYVEELADLQKEFEKHEKTKPTKTPVPEVNEEGIEAYIQAIPEVGNAVFDLAGGAACALKKIFPKTVFSEPDPLYVRHSAEPTPDAVGVLASETKKNACLGFAFDGDADRCVAVDSGKMVDTGILAAFFASNFLPKGSKIVLTLDFQQEVFDFLADAGFNPSYSPVGDVFVLKKAEESNADFAAEKSGHYSVFKHIPYSDGIYFSALVSQSKAGELNDFAKQFSSVFLSDSVHGVSVDLKKLEEAVKSRSPERIETIDGIKASFDEYTFLIRPSNTQPLVRVSVEAKSRGGAVHALGVAKQLVLDCKVHN
jgi:phosphomannomutase